MHKFDKKFLVAVLLINSNYLLKKMVSTNFSPEKLLITFINQIAYMRKSNVNPAEQNCDKSL